MKSDFVFQKAREWISECEHNHDQCPGPTIPLLPTRVIDVGRENQQPRLHVSTPGERARYVALSYCWGGDQPYATKKGTIHQKIGGIPMQELGQSIQDAITVARNISIRYIWIDALCIIQDDDDDKNRELAVMGDIYRRATVAITAANAARAADGFLHPLPELSSVSCPFLTSENTQGSGALVEHKWTLHNRAAGDPTDRRGWCFQEALLPCRRLVFGTQGLSWDCLQEDSKPVVEGNIHVLRSFKMLPPSTWGLPTQDPIPPAREQARMWKNLVKQFAKRELTKPDEDRTRAISGIGNVLADVHGDEYLSEVAMFRKSLLFQIDWRVDGFTARSRSRRAGGKTPTVVRIEGLPTWSWASVTGPISSLAMGKMSAEVIDDGSEITANELRSGLLRLRAKVIHGSRVEVGARRDWRVEFDLVEGDAFDDRHWFAFLGLDSLGQYSVGLVVSLIDGTNPQEWQRVGWFCANCGHDAVRPWSNIWDEKDVAVRDLVLR